MSWRPRGTSSCPIQRSKPLRWSAPSATPITKSSRICPLRGRSPSSGKKPEPSTPPLEDPKSTTKPPPQPHTANPSSPRRSSAHAEGAIYDALHSLRNGPQDLRRDAVNYERLSKITAPPTALQRPGITTVQAVLVLSGALKNWPKR